MQLGLRDGVWPHVTIIKFAPQVNETLEEMDDLTRDTEQQLITAGQMLQTTGAFDGTVNGTTVDELLHQILYYNTTITNLVYSAFHLLTE